jgi:uncharacterized membrane protein HdeD (DUF308 family)
MTEPVTSLQKPEHRARWKWFLALGVILLVLGVAGIGIATALEFTSLLVFGPLVMASSVIQFLTAFMAEKRRECLLHLAAAGVEAVLGVAIMASPPERVIGLITLVAVLLIVIGLARVARSLATRSGGRAWVFAAGVIALLLGISVWAGGTAGKLGFVGLCIAVDLLCHGVT